MKKRILPLLLAFVLALPIVLVNIVAESLASTAVLTVEEAWINPGDTVEIDLEISENPGVLGATLTVWWDEGLTMIADANGSAFAHMTYVSPSRYVSSGTNFVWYGNALDEAVDGTILTLSFQLSEAAVNEELMSIGVTYTNGDVVDANDDDVIINITDGYVRVITYKPGDVTGDGRVNSRDLVRLSQYISDGVKTDPEGYNAEVVANACDVNGDGRINARDLIKLSQYISDGSQTNPDGYNAVLVPAKSPEHNYSNLTKIDSQAATCTENGNIAYWTCADCGKLFGDAEATTEISYADTILSATGHTEVVDAAVVATCTTTGLTEGKHCSVCNEVLVSQAVVNALGHTEVVDEAAVDPTCTATGLSEGKHCSVCSQVISSQKALVALGHSYSNNACTVCDHSITPSTGLAYSLQSDGTYMITGIGTCGDKVIVIPANINGKKVTYIAEEAFFNKGSFDGLYIPGTVKSIGSQAFRMSFFDFIYMEEGVQSVGSEAFAGTYGYNSLIVIPSTLTSIGSYAFMCGVDCVVINNETVAKGLTVYDAMGYILFNSSSVLIRSDLSYGSYVNNLGSSAISIEFMGTQYNSFSHKQNNYVSHAYDIYTIQDWSGLRCSTCHMVSDFTKTILDISESESDSVTAHIYKEDGKIILKIFGNGNMIDSPPTSQYYKIIDEIIIENGVTSISSYAFDYFTALTSVTIPKDVTSIRQNAFGDCTSLTDVYYAGTEDEWAAITIESGNDYLINATIHFSEPVASEGLEFTLNEDAESYSVTGIGTCTDTEIIIPSTYNGLPVTSIGDSAFSECTTITSVYIPEGILEIGEYAFEYCSNLTQVDIPSTLAKFGQYAFQACKKLEFIPSFGSATVVPKGLYYNCYSGSIREITVPNTIVSIECYAFGCIDTLAYVYLPTSVTSIGESAFTNPFGHTTLIYQGTAKQWEQVDKDYYWADNYTFRIEGGTSVGLSYDLCALDYRDESTYYYAVSGIGDCTDLDVVIPSTYNGYPVTEIRSNAFLESSLIRITIPDSVTSIGDYAFSKCESLTSIVISDNLTSIGNYVFYNCTKLNSIAIPDSVTSIGSYAFSNCTGLTSVTIGNGVTSIGSGAFDSCSKLTSVTIGNGVTSIGKWTFCFCTALTDIYYTGTETEWEAITIDGNNEPLINATIHYNS